MRVQDEVLLMTAAVRSLEGTSAMSLDCEGATFTRFGRQETLDAKIHDIHSWITIDGTRAEGIS
jgi:hypothetical protein